MERIESRKIVTEPVTTALTAIARFPKFIAATGKGLTTEARRDIESVS